MEEQGRLNVMKTADGAELNNVLYKMLLPKIEKYNRNKKGKNYSLFRFCNRANGSIYREVSKWGLNMGYTQEWLKSTTSEEIIRCTNRAIMRDQALVDASIIDVCLKEFSITNYVAVGKKTLEESGIGKKILKEKNRCLICNQDMRQKIRKRFKNIIETEWMPDGYFLFLKGKPLEFIEPKNPTAQGLILVPGKNKKYPLINSAFVHFFGARVKNKNDGFVISLKKKWETPMVLARIIEPLF